MLIQGDKSQGGKGFGVGYHPFRLDARPLQGVSQQAAKGILPHFAHKGGPGPITAQGRQEIARRAAGIGLQSRIPLPVGADRSKIHQQFTQRYHVIHCDLLHTRAVKRPSFFLGAEDPSFSHYPAAFQDTWAVNRPSSRRADTWPPIRSARALTMAIPRPVFCPVRIRSTV